MDFFKQIWNKIKEPHGIYLALFYVCFVLIVTGTIVLVALVPTSQFYHYILYVLAAVCLAYFVYTIVIFAPKIKNKIIQALNSHPFTKTMLSSYGYRTIIFSIISFIINLLFVALQGVLAIITKSWWYITITIYYLLLSLMKGTVLLSKKKYGSNEIKQAKTFRFVGILLVVLMVAFSGVIVLIYTSNKYFEYAGLLIYVVSTFTFYKLTLAIINIFKAKQHNDLYIHCIRNINLASSFISIIVLQVAMFQAFSKTSNAGFANALTGAGVAAIIITIGVLMIIKANKKIKSLENSNENNQQIQI